MGARGVIGLVLLVGGGALAFAIGAGFNPLQAVQDWANSASVAPAERGGAKASDPGNSSEPIGSRARTSGGKAG